MTMFRTDPTFFYLSISFGNLIDPTSPNRLEAGSVAFLEKEGRRVSKGVRVFISEI